MWQPDSDQSFWLAVFGATIVKMATSPYKSLIRAILTGFAAVFAAWIFTDPFINWFSLSQEVYRVPAAALLALTGEGIMRFLIRTANDPTQLLDWWDKWRS